MRSALPAPGKIAARSHDTAARDDPGGPQQQAAAQVAPTTPVLKTDDTPLARADVTTLGTHRTGHTAHPSTPTHTKQGCSVQARDQMEAPLAKLILC